MWLESVKMQAAALPSVNMVQHTTITAEVIPTFVECLNTVNFVLNLGCSISLVPGAIELQISRQDKALLLQYIRFVVSSVESSATTAQIAIIPEA